MTDSIPPSSKQEDTSDRPTLPVPADMAERRAKDVYSYCKGLSFGASIATALFDKGPL